MSSLAQAPKSIALLGPQRLKPNLAQVVDRLDVRGKVAAITAGWQEREEEDQELRDHLGRRVYNLELHRRGEEIYRQDRELFGAHRERQDRLRSLLQLYRYRLDYTIQPVRELLQRELAQPAESGLLTTEVELALEALRHLDAEYLRRIREENEAFEKKHTPSERPAVQEHRREVEDMIADSEAVAIAGGHVAVLLNRIRLFDLARVFAGKAIFAWSAGAMLLGQRVVLFHDHPPQGAGNAEVFEEGLGLYPGLVALPHARYRLSLGDQQRVSLFARRFAPARCVPLDAGACVLFEEGRCLPDPGTQHLDVSGALLPLEAG